MKVKIINYIVLYLTLKKNEKEVVSCAALGTCIVELQDRVGLRNVDVYEELEIGHSVYNDLKKG